MKEKSVKPQNKNGKPRLYSFRIRKSPYFEATERYGCKSYTSYNNMYLPLVYEDIVSDYWHIKKGVTLWDVACQRQVEITGSDAYKFLQYLTPRNLSNFKVGQCKYVALTTEDAVCQLSLQFPKADLQNFHHGDIIHSLLAYSILIGQE